MQDLPDVSPVLVKPWYLSRTIWLSVLSVLLPTVTYMMDNALDLGIPHELIPWLALVIFSLGSIRQRFATVQPIGLKREVIGMDNREAKRKMADEELDEGHFQ